MIKDLLIRATSIKVINGGKTINLENFNTIWDELLNYAYVATSFKEATPEDTATAIKSGIWLELDMGKEMNQEGYKFEKLLIAIKPKYTWLTCIRYYDGNYQGKCFNVNLSTNTTQLYKYLKSLF